MNSRATTTSEHEDDKPLYNSPVDDKIDEEEDEVFVSSVSTEAAGEGDFEVEEEGDFEVEEEGDFGAGEGSVGAGEGAFAC
jgi:hypothetical protein